MEPERLQPERQPGPRPETQRPEPRRPASEPQISKPGERPAGRTPPADSGRGGQAESRKPSSAGPAKPSSSSGMLLKVFAVVVLALMGWLYFGHNSTTSAGAEESAPNYQKNRNADPSVPAAFAAQDIDRAMTDRVREAALRGDPIPGVTNPSPAFIEAAKRGEVTFYAVRAYDTCAEDGDVVTLRLPVGGEIGPIPLTIAGTTVSIPVVAGTPAQLTVVAVKDGVGGVTLGVQTSGGVWFSQVMPVGGTETMPLAIH